MQICHSDTAALACFQHTQKLYTRKTLTHSTHSGHKAPRENRHTHTKKKCVRDRLSCTYYCIIRYCTQHTHARTHNALRQQQQHQHVIKYSCRPVRNSYSNFNCIVDGHIIREHTPIVCSNAYAYDGHVLVFCRQRMRKRRPKRRRRRRKRRRELNEYSIIHTYMQMRCAPKSGYAKYA